MQDGVLNGEPANYELYASLSQEKLVYGNFERL